MQSPTTEKRDDQKSNIMARMKRNPWKKLLANTKASGRRAADHTVSRAGQMPEHDLTVHDLSSLFYEQNERCALIGIKINPEHIFIQRHPLAPSVDRLDNNKGYTKDNIQITSRLANLGKKDYDDELFKKEVAPTIELDYYRRQKEQEIQRHGYPFTDSYCDALSYHFNQNHNNSDPHGDASRCYSEEETCGENLSKSKERDHEQGEKE